MLESTFPSGSSCIGQDWALGFPLLGSMLKGSPARAGIDPEIPIMLATCLWFPRTRGDRPIRNGVSDVGNEVPPHARG